MTDHAIQLFWRGLEMWLLTGPVFGGLGAVLAKMLRRRQGVWFLLGYIFNAAAVLFLLYLWLRQKPWQADNSDYENSD